MSSSRFSVFQESVTPSFNSFSSDYPPIELRQVNTNSRGRLQLLSANIHIFSDVAIFLLPQKIIWNLNMSLQRRLGIEVVFGLGAL
jgi:hypothetical protein